jgi:hypothetical protein
LGTGLDHQDEDFDNANLGTCTDYTNDPTTNQHPTAHDYEKLEIIYAHLDSFTTSGAAAPRGDARSLDTRESWGQSLRAPLTAARLGSSAPSGTTRR